MSNILTVLLVDDHGIVRDGIRGYLNTVPDIRVVGEAATGEEAVRLAGELSPDVILMDLAMPGMDGVEATRRIRKFNPHSQVVVLTSFHEDAHIFPAIKAGALSYILKDVSAEDLVAAIKAAGRGEAVLNSQVTGRLVQEMRGGEDSEHYRGGINPFTDLSEREQEVLRLIAQGMSNSEIAGRLSVSERTVKSHVSRILYKLNLSDRTQAAVFAWKMGMAKKD